MMARLQQAGGVSGWWAKRRMAAKSERDREAAVLALYAALVEKARSVELYRDYGVPDTPDGRFEMLALHVAMALRSLARHEHARNETSRGLVELMVKDMDRSVRELGVGDLSVGKYVKRMIASLYARLETLEQAIAEADASAVARMLQHKVFNAAPDQPSPELVQSLARLLVERAIKLQQEPLERLLSGDLH
jgi:cytochrome b pre-mRNA-processing protein 3